MRQKKGNKMKLNTVNVLEIIDNVPNCITSFEDNPAGNKEAEDLFIKIAKENGAKKRDMKRYFEDGYFGDTSEYVVYLIHS